MSSDDAALFGTFPIGDREVLDRFDFDTDENFPKWLNGWRKRWIAGERVSVLLDAAESHVVVVADPNAKRPTSCR